MQRNMNRIIADYYCSNLLPTAYDMNYDEWRELANRAIKGEPVTAVREAFVYGFALGVRCSENRAKRAAKKTVTA